MFVLLVVGVVVTGTGPHSGDEMASRFGFDIETVARIHADVAYVVVGLTFALAFALHITDAPGPARRAAWTLLGVEAAQGVIGYVQYFLGVPAALVNLHVLGATLVWVCALRVVFATGPRGPGTPRRRSPASSTPSASEPPVRPHAVRIRTPAHRPRRPRPSHPYATTQRPHSTRSRYGWTMIGCRCHARPYGAATRAPCC